ncbi:YjbF family lipoprotein [Pseudomonas sp. GD04087]|uniref:YjbF family lipoprotein n=1 Tax=unclassified Pseudomonas TaxID=196821 RepID=UPI00244B0BDE|nr:MULTISPECIES: YjbF family lipoprotein [unclassified Pseudomonas]MDH0291981.1 YjbF family lipoprotein [Pseudomonas sp. GD04087]MDH1052829.1 YjbF family lipoprotein [Pseudomonas sp. GD03903]MDH2001992.1 YjbF family lipoprotein [Pseudomonas sp. GD03691]
MNAYRLLALVVLACALAACNPLMQASLSTLGASLGSPAPLELTRAQVNALPYYQIEVTTEYGSAVMALVRTQGDLQYWQASSRQLLLLQDGVVVRTLGFPDDLLGTRLAPDSPFISGLQHIGEEQASQRWIDLGPGYLLDVPLTGKLRRVGNETVRILDQDHRLLRIDEHLSAPIKGMAATNRYWVDPSDGFILQSRQQVTPSLNVTITQLRPLRSQP